MQILSVFSQLILNSFMNAYLILRGQTFSSLTGQTSGLPIIELRTDFFAFDLLKRGILPHFGKERLGGILQIM